MLHTTFARAKKAGACIESYRKFAKYKGGVKKWGKDTPFPLSEVLEVCGLKDALWTLRVVVEDADREIRLFACDCAERVLPIYRQAIEISRKFVLGEATSTELDAARDAAMAARDARAAACIAGAAAWVAEGEWQRARFIRLLDEVKSG